MKLCGYIKSPVIPVGLILEDLSYDDMYCKILSFPPICRGSVFCFLDKNWGRDTYSHVSAHLMI